jgi:saccharopine dehydrogenase-like NADP-dependent oxidoreductase
MPKTVLVIGAGRSATYLIDYLLTHAATFDWQLIIADLSLELARKKAAGHPLASAQSLNLDDPAALQKAIRTADLVVSLAPADKHIHIAKVCLTEKKSLFTASYVSAEMQAMHTEVDNAGLLFFNELGCDPGIDHMSALALLAEIKQAGGEIEAFYSFTGGLIAREAIDNPWAYKFSWNPRNVILAGQPGPARYLANGVVRYIPYQRLFQEVIPFEIAGFGKLEGYANRDSVPYREQYGLQQVKTLLRGTLRYPGYASAWHVLVWLGLTNDQLKLQQTHKLRFRDFLLAFLPPDPAPTVKESLVNALQNYLGYSQSEIADVLIRFEAIDLFSDRCFQQTAATPAQLLQEILEEKWALKSGERDLVVMTHRIDYRDVQGILKQKNANLLLEGDNDYHTAMAKTVGLPLAIAVKNFLNGKINLKGVHIPVQAEVYSPILAELAELGIVFHEN